MKPINSCVLIENKDGNRYFFDRKMKRLHPTPPLLHDIISLYLDGADIETWLNNQTDNPKAHYYYKKFLLLKSKGYFSEINQEELFDTELSPGQAQNTLANIKQITFEVTDSCNLRCKYCGYGEFYEDYDRRENKNMDTAAAKRILDYFKTLWNSPMNRSHDRNVYISFYGGEPLLNFPFIREITSYVNELKTLHNRFTFSMTTNALLLEKTMDFLAENEFYLLISLDGDEINNSYRVFSNGKSAFSDIMRNIEALQKKYPSYFKERVNFNAVLHNKNSVSAIFDFIRKHFDKIPSINSLNTTGIKESKKKEFSETYSNFNESLNDSEDYSLIEKEMFIKLPGIQSLSLFLDQCSEFVFDDYNDLIYDNLKMKRIPTGTCIPFSKKVFVTVNGKILPCERIGQHHAFGRVTPCDIELNEETIANIYNTNIRKLKKQCHSCYNAEMCFQCVFNLDNLETAPICRGHMNANEYSKYLASIIESFEQKPGTYVKLLEEALIE